MSDDDKNVMRCDDLCQFMRSKVTFVGAYIGILPNNGALKLGMNAAEHSC